MTKLSNTAFLINVLEMLESEINAAQIELTAEQEAKIRQAYQILEDEEA